MPDPITPDTPGKDITFDKPGIPDCWEPQPVKIVTDPDEEENG